MKSGLSEKWIKASIIGTIWAAFEIVFGSFLHNLKIPFSGNILTAIGIIILISISYSWKEKGLFWRAGLICAILKTFSPSAVIFGPMIAIFSEAILLEFFVRFIGRTIPGYLLGAMMAMSWNLFQKIANYVIFYGSGIVEVYTNLLQLAQKQLHLQSDIVWLPVIVLLVVYALFGLFAGIIGIRVGRKAMNNLSDKSPGTTSNSFLNQQKNPGHEFKYSLTWLFINFLLIVTSFILLNYTSWIVWSIVITGIVVIWALRYKRALRQLSKPKFWIFFVLITLITAFVFTEAEPGADVVQKGLLTGIQMNFRAVVIIVGFAVTGTELYNPVIRNYFLGTSFKHLPLAIELSVESLPFFIASIPDFNSIVRNPISVFSQFILHAESRLSEIRGKAVFSQKVFIIGGSVSEGKTSFAKNLIEVFRKNNIPVGGILSERVMADSRTIGYDLVDIETNATEILLRESDGNSPERIGRFAVYPKGFEMGVKILSPSRLIGKRIVIIDEVGTLELNNRGWSGCISGLVNASNNHLVITVRDSLTEEVIQKWNFSQPFVCKVSETNYLSCSKTIMEQINLP